MLSKLFERIFGPDKGTITVEHKHTVIHRHETNYKEEPVTKDASSKSKSTSTTRQGGFPTERTDLGSWG